MDFTLISHDVRIGGTIAESAPIWRPDWEDEEFRGEVFAELWNLVDRCSRLVAKPFPDAFIACGQPTRVRLGRSGERVLIVDDGTAYRAKLESLLKSEQFHVTKTETLEQGLELVRSHVIDCVICDADGDVADGLELARQAKADQRLAHIPIVVLRGEQSSRSVCKYLESGADDCVAKTEKVLSELVARVRGPIANRGRVYAWARGQGHPLAPADIGLPWSVDIAELPAEGKTWVLDIEQRIRLGFAKSSFSVENLADQLGCVTRSLERKCVEFVGLRPAALIRFARLVRAREFLLEGKDIKYARGNAGVPPHSDFLAHFERLFGITPSELKRRVARGEKILDNCNGLVVSDTLTLIRSG